MAKPYEHIDYFNPRQEDEDHDEIDCEGQNHRVVGSSSIHNDNDDESSVSSGMISIEQKVTALECIFDGLKGEHLMDDQEVERHSEISYDHNTEDVDTLRRELEDADRNHSLSWKEYLASLKKNSGMLPSTAVTDDNHTEDEEEMALKLEFGNVSVRTKDDLTWDDIIQRSAEHAGMDFADELSEDSFGAIPEKKTTSEHGSGKSSRLKRFAWILLLILAVVIGTVLLLFNGSNDGPADGPRSNQVNKLVTEAPSTSTIPQKPPTASGGATVAPVAASPTMAPDVGQPSMPTFTAAPTPSRKTVAPTLSPVYREEMVRFLQTEYSVDFQDSLAHTNQAIDWLMSEDPHEMDHKFAQRFSLVALDYSLQDNSATTAARTASLTFPVIATSKIDECQWQGVNCNGEGWVIKLNLNGQWLKGDIPSEIRILQDTLTVLDLSENEISGSIPDGLFQLTKLERLYLYQNKLSGVVSPEFGVLENLTHLHASHNNFDGPLPNDFRRMTNLRYLNLYRNRITGKLPSYMKYMSSLWYLDLGHNELSGDLPSGWGDGLDSLRHLFLDHNNFDGYIPSKFTKLGGYELETLNLSDNKLVGAVPYEHSPNVPLGLVTYNLKNNMFSKELDKHLCELSTFESGQIVEFNADCSICVCSNFFCSACPQ